MHGYQEEMVGAVIALWEMGFDTRRMAVVLQERESDCERWLHIGLEKRRADAATDFQDDGR